MSGETPTTGSVSRRQFLRLGGAAAAGLGVAGTLGAAPVIARERPVASGARLGEPVGGPLGDIYGRFGFPRGLTLSFTSSVLGERTVTWLTSGDMAVPSRVQFGPVPVKATQKDIDSGSYLVHDVAGWSELAPQGHFDYDNNRVSAIDGEVPVRVHRATMTGIPEGTRIAYRVGSPDGWSDIRTFEASPRRDQGFRFTHFGDHATHVASRRNTAAVLARRPAFHLLAGDIAYADGWQPQWDRWANEIEPLTASVPLVTSLATMRARTSTGRPTGRGSATPTPAATGSASTTTTSISSR